MKVSKAQDERDTRKALQRYVDQPGQWVNTTPKALMARQEKGLKALAESMNKQEAKKKTPAKKKTK